MSEQALNDAIDFDPDALRDKYREERDKRMRADGNEQYVEIKGDYARYLEDPYVETRIERDPFTDDTDVVIIGGGFGGLLAGARLREAGVKNLRMIEKGGEFGGTWYWNRYPGAACDIESYVYLPLLEETGFMPVEKYTRAPEILAHSKRIAEKYDLYQQCRASDRGRRSTMGRKSVTLDHQDQSRRRDESKVRRQVERPSASAKAAGHQGC